MKRLFLFFVIISSPSFAQNYGTWDLIDSLNIPRRYAASTELSTGNILVTGGEDYYGIKDAEIYDYKTGKWEKTTPMVIGRAYHKLVKLNDGRVLSIGGYHTKSCEIFDITSKTWLLTDSINIERSMSETATLLDNGDVLVVGGYYLYPGKAKFLSSCEIYDVNTAKWVIIDSLAIARELHTATKLSDGRVLVAGGFSDVNKELSNCVIYDPKTSRWVVAAPLNIARYSHSATLLPDGKVLVTGGENYADLQNPWLNSCELYDPEKNTWTMVDSLLAPHTYHSPIILKNGLLLIAGGGINSDVWELYDPNNFSNVYIAYYPAKQSASLINLLPDGKVLAAGGMTWSIDEYGLPMQLNAKMCYLYDPNGIDGVANENKNVVKDFNLSQNYPNPFNPTTVINYQLPKASKVTLKVYNVLGEEIMTLVNSYMSAGAHSVTFNAGKLASGVYLYRLDAETYTQSKKMILTK